MRDRATAMSNFTTSEIISYVLGDAPPALADEVARAVETDRELSAKVQLLRCSAGSSTAAAIAAPSPDAPLLGLPSSAKGRRLRRWQIAAAACIGLLVLSSLSWGAWELVKPRPLLQDAFARAWFDSTIWKSERPILKAERGYLALMNRGSFRTEQEFHDPIDLRFEWRWRDLAGCPHYSENLSVALRTSGTHGKKHPFAVQDGVVVTFHTYPGRVSMRWASGEEPNAVQCKDGTLPFVADAWYSLRVTDDGDEVAVYVRGPEVDPGYWIHPVVQRSYRGPGGGSFLAIFNREAVAGVPHESHIRNLEVWPLTERRPR
jgi:hypothetical protein